MPKDQIRLHSDHLRGNPRRVLGVNDGKLIQCEKHAQFYPAAESCPWCLSWAEEMEERAKKVTVKDAEPVKVERTLGRRLFDSYSNDDGGRDQRWAHEDQQYWENVAQQYYFRRGSEWFDATYP